MNRQKQTFMYFQYRFCCWIDSICQDGYTVVVLKLWFVKDTMLIKGDLNYIKYLHYILYY